jgi:hypothetical protein
MTDPYLRTRLVLKLLNIIDWLKPAIKTESVIIRIQQVRVVTMILCLELNTFLIVVWWSAAYYNYILSIVPETNF